MPLAEDLTADLMAKHREERLSPKTMQILEVMGMTSPKTSVRVLCSKAKAASLSSS